MYKKFEEYMSDFLDEDSSPDFWYDVASAQAYAILRNFSENDWARMIKELDSRPLEFKKKLAYCLNDSSNSCELEVLLILVDTNDDELFVTCVDSLRDFINPNSKKVIKKKEILISKIDKRKETTDNMIKTVYADFLRKLQD
jgi:hypothetical protein